MGCPLRRFPLFAEEVSAHSENGCHTISAIVDLLDVAILAEWDRLMADIAHSGFQAVFGDTPGGDPKRLLTMLVLHLDLRTCDLVKLTGYRKSTICDALSLGSDRVRPGRMTLESILEDVLGEWGRRLWEAYQLLVLREGTWEEIAWVHQVNQAIIAAVLAEKSEISEAV